MIIRNSIKLFNFIGCQIMQLWNHLKFKSYGPQVSIGGDKHKLIGTIYLRLRKTGKLVIGNNLSVTSGFCYNPISRNIRTAFFVENNAIINIGDNVGISGACIWAHESITIGNNVNIGGDVVIIDSDCHSLDYNIRCSKEDQKQKKNKPIVIEDDVLIGARSIILKGVTIGARSIVGAGSVVSKSIPSDEIWAGNPAKFIKKIHNE